MTVIPTQFCSISQAYAEENTSLKKDAPSYKDYFSDDFFFKFKRHHLSECCFLSDRACKISFIKKSVSESFYVNPSVDKQMFKGEDLLNQADYLSNWDRLYIELFKCRYIVSHSRVTDSNSSKPKRIRILTGIEDLKSSVNLDVNYYEKKLKNKPKNISKIGNSLYLSIEGRDIRLWCETNNVSDRARIKNLMWRIPILYIIAHAYVKRTEKLIDEMQNEHKSLDPYAEFLYFRMNKYRSNPVVIERTVIINRIWNFLAKYYKVEKNIEELNTIIKDYQNERNSRLMMGFSVISALAAVASLCFAFKSFLNDSDAVKSIVYFFIHGTV